MTGPLAAVTLGMLAYLILYPPISWVFATMIALGVVLGGLLLLPIGAADGPAAIALLNALSGLAMCVAGSAARDGVLVMAGALVAAAGFVLSLVARVPTGRSPLAVLLTAFGEPN